MTDKVPAIETTIDNPARDLNALFNEDPLFLSDADIDAMTERFRKERHRFALEERKAAAKGTKFKPAGAAGNVKVTDLAL